MIYCLSSDFQICNTVFFFFINLFIYLILKFLAAFGLRCCARGFSSCSERGLLFVVVHGLLLLRSTGSRRAEDSVTVARKLSCCDSQALELRLSSCATQA